MSGIYIYIKYKYIFIIEYIYHNILYIPIHFKEPFNNIKISVGI